MKRILIVNGPNLNLLGVREPEIYGHQSMEDYLEALRVDYPQVQIDYFQSNHEGDIIDRLHAAAYPDAALGDDAQADAVVLNAGAYTHTSLAIADAIRAIAPAVPVVEVHISNTAAREDIRHGSLISGVCRGTIAGFGLDSYRLALEALI